MIILQFFPTILKKSPKFKEKRQHNFLKTVVANNINKLLQ